MGNLTKVRTQFILILTVLGVLDLALIGYLLLPGFSKAGKMAQEQALQQKADALSHEVAPLQNIGDTLARTRIDVRKFYEQKIPSQSSEISQRLEKLVQETGVTTPGFHYSQEIDRSGQKAELPDIQRIGIETTVTGEYGKVARFINALEQDRLVFVITQISLNSAEGGAVSLQIHFETFLRQT
ncbi:MAG TPA: hypothetical protein VIB39_08090 [Candidatus Angelobacter sp.]|jgi:Tfp pilus assembly protein PilO